MSFSTRFAATIGFAFACACLAQAQEEKDYSSEEDSKLNRIIERWLQQHETEREHVLREASRGKNGELNDDFDDWYASLGGDAKGWDRTRIQRKNAGEIFDRIAERLRHGGPILTRSQFIGYAREHWKKDKSPPWRPPQAFDTGAEADRLFKHLDRDRDGVLAQNELSPVLRASLKRWDSDNDGRINLSEYQVFFAYRLDRVYRSWQQRSEKPLPILTIMVRGEDRPRVARAGNLPPGLPAWFEQLATDEDGQVALFEWRRAKWSIDEFEKLDGNEDGFLDINEILRLLAQTERDGRRPYAYPLHKRYEPPGVKVDKR